MRKIDELHYVYFLSNAGEVYCAYERDTHFDGKPIGPINPFPSHVLHTDWFAEAMILWAAMGASWDKPVTNEMLL